MIPSLLFLYTKSAARNSVPPSWKNAKVSAAFKKDNKTDKHNCRPISLLRVPGKLIEQAVATRFRNIILAILTSGPIKMASQSNCC